MKHIQMSHRILLAVLTLAVVGLGVYIFFGNGTKATKSIAVYAHEMVERCKNASYRPLCYEQEVPKLVSDLSTERIFDVVRQIRRDDPEYLYCHVLAHELGVYEVSLDPDKWLDVIAKGPTDGLCSNGYAHGALVARFNDEDLSPEEFEYALQDLSIACEKREGWNPTDLTKAICYHGIGHVMIHMTLSNIDDSLRGCEVVGLKEDGRDYRQLCVEGVYMQLFQPLEPEDFALVGMLPYEPTRGNLFEFCSEFSRNDEQLGACWREGWPFFREDIYNSEGVINYCSVLTPAQDRDLCFVSAFTINGRHNLGDIKRMADVCNGLPSEYKGNCFGRGANAFPEEDPALVPQAIDMCSRANEVAAQNECYGFLARVASFNFHEGSPAFEQLCTSLPSEFESACRRGR
jgi:hypothetical protein